MHSHTGRLTSMHCSFHSTKTWAEIYCSWCTQLQTLWDVKTVTGFWNSLRPCLILEISAETEVIKQCNLVEQTCVRLVSLWNTLEEKKTNSQFSLFLTVPYFSNTLSLHEKSSGHLDHFWSLASLISLSSFILPSTSAHILLPTYPEASISTKDVRQWFHTDRMRQCVSSITGHREQLEQVILLVRVCYRVRVCMYVCVSVCASAYEIAKVQVWMCVCLWCCDVKTLPERPCRGRRGNEKRAGTSRSCNWIKGKPH